ncbi:MAG: hypothetical protein IPK33_15425 [Gemmatimonadetes bacterium]|jgi:predicted transcriptional regulator|nr:hypothetical protein [Gemmatimonadota bacterium]
MSTPRDIRPEAKALVDRLSADATWDDLQYEIYVRQAVDAGLADADTGRLVEHEQAMARVRAAIRRVS